MAIRRFLGKLSLAALCTLSTPAFAADVIIGVPAWPSAEVTAHVLATVMKSDLGIEAKMEPRGTLGILTGIDAGEVHIHPEVWFPNLRDAVDRFSNEKGTLRMAKRVIPAAQNICVTKTTMEQTGIDEVKDLADPAMAAHFDSNDDGLGEMWIGAESWSSTPIERVRAKSYGYDQTMTLLEGPEEVAMAAVDVSASLNRPIVFYCYKPHHIFQLHEIRVLSEPPHDPATWSISGQPDPKTSKAGSAWAPSSYQIGYATSLEASSPKVAEFLNRVDIGSRDAAEMSYAVQVERKSPAEVAKTWIENNTSRIMEWTK